MFEAWKMLLCGEMPVVEAGRLLGEEDTRLWRIVAHYVEEAQRLRDWSKVRRIMLDETSARRGHKYITSIVDADTRELPFMAEGRERAALAAFVEELRAHDGVPEQIELVSMDMSPAYRKGVREHLPRGALSLTAFISCRWPAKPWTMCERSCGMKARSLQADSGPCAEQLDALAGTTGATAAALQPIPEAGQGDDAAGELAGRAGR